MWFTKKKSADLALQELVDGLSKALGPRLLSVVLYGSKASGEYHEDRSDVNVFLLLENAAWETLELMAPPVRAWLKAGHAMPVFVQRSELPRYMQNFPVEFLDMQDHHNVIFGLEPLQGLIVDRTNLRAQCAEELSAKQLKLRQGILMAEGNATRLRDLINASLPSVLTLFRAVLRLESDVPKGHKILAAQELSKKVGFDGDSLGRLWEAHVRRETDNVEDLAKHYLDSIDRVLVYVNRKKIQ